MRRIIVLSTLLLALTGAVPSHADTVIEGFVVAPVPAPSVPRTLFRVSGGEFNGPLGYVAEIPASDAERPFTLTPGATGVGAVNLDAWFYSEIAGTGEPCARVATDTFGGGENGTVCAGAKYVVVVLFYGADTDFTLDIA